MSSEDGTPPRGPRGNLPQALTSFVGRRRELDAIRRRMAEARLVTLVGPGGVGKTRLAVQAGCEARRAFGDGAWMIDLAALRDPALVAQTIVSVLGIPDQSQRPAEEKLTGFLGGARVLLILDNCEHLIDACATLVAGLLRGAPHLQVLATSREGLGIAGEHLYAVNPLSTPDARFPPPLADAGRYESIALLADRARAVRPGFAIDEDNLTAAVELCAALDGLPLAIELAATRLRSLGIAEVRDRLSDRFSLLNAGHRDAVPRQKTLWALIDWSHELCSREEQLLWSRLSVFDGSFDLAAAEAVCARPPDLPRNDIVDVLDQLVTKSIVTMDPRGARVRYRMLVSMRDFGAERVTDHDELRRAHRDHYLTQAGTMVGEWWGPGQAAQLARMKDDHPNLQAALAFCETTEGEASAGAAFAASLRFHWLAGGLLATGRRWLDAMLVQTPGPSAERGAALWVSAWVALVQGDHEYGRACAAECAELAAALGDGGLAAHADHWDALSDLFAGDLESSIESFERAVRGHAEAGNSSSQLLATFQLVAALAYQGEHARAAEICEASLRRCDAAGERWNRAYLLWTRGLLAWRMGELSAAERWAVEALAEQREFHDGINVALTIELLAWVAGADLRHAEAAGRLGAADAVWSAIGTQIDAFGPHLSGDSHRTTSACCAALGETRFAALRAAPSRLEMDRAIDAALGIDHSHARESDESPLTVREREVVTLIAAGKTNRAIAEALIVSPRTVDGHVERIFSKLGFSSRAQVAAWAADHPLSSVG